MARWATDATNEVDLVQPPSDWLERQVHRFRFCAAVDPPATGPFCSVEVATERALRKWAKLTPEERARQARSWARRGTAPDGDRRGPRVI